jgi:hypothetical protein
VVLAAIGVTLVGALALLCVKPAPQHTAGDTHLASGDDRAPQAPPGRAVVWGTAPEATTDASTKYEVFYARPPSSSEPVYRELPARLDERHRWSFDCDVNTDWLVWLTQDGAIVSNIERIHVDRSRAYGPIQLAPMSLKLVNVRLIHLPGRGKVTTLVYDLAGGPTQRDFAAFSHAELSTSLSVQGPVDACFQCSASPRNSLTESSEWRMIDPQASREVVVDMHGDRMRGVVFRVNGEAPKGETLLALIALDEAGAFAGRTTTFTILDGKSDVPAPLPGGSYLYSLTGDADRGLICGTTTVRDAADQVAATIDWHGKSVPREKLGHGVELVSVDGVSCANLKQFTRQILWRTTKVEDASTLLVPEKCEYVVLE